MWWRMTLSMALAAASAADADYASAARKVRQIESGRAPVRSTITFSPREANAYAREELRQAVGNDIRDLKIELGAGTVKGAAWINFAKLQTAKGQPPGMLVRMLLNGERHVAVTLAVKPAGHGECQVDVREVAIAGVAVSGRTLDLLIDYFLLPRHPELTLGKPFELRHGVDRVDVTPAGVQVKIGG